jgi:exodeoxyribonuclease VII large subunit
MFQITLRKLTLWRNETAKKEGVELFRVLPNKTLEEIAHKCPGSKAEMIEIKGIKDAKFNKYGRDILGIIKEDQGGAETDKPSAKKANLSYFREKAQEKKQEEKILSVGEFWDIVNEKLWSLQVKIRGEVSSVDNRNNVIYFSLKDKKDESVMNCLIFKYQYEVLGINLQEGMEVMVEGCPEVYKPYGKLSFKTNVIELEGEGVLKKEYEMLRRKLEEEGIFDEQNKKALCALPQNIGLITSRDGAAIGDFISNIGKYGLKIKFVNSSVEGKRAVFELMNAVKLFRKMKDLDALVIIRGGGSLESLQAFNNEALIRCAKALKVPIICGVGHDRDISLLSLAADYSVSTPTAAAKLIGNLWEREIDKISYHEKNILAGFEKKFQNEKYKLENCTVGIERGFQNILEEAESKYDYFLSSAFKIIERDIVSKKARIADFRKDYCSKFESRLAYIGNNIESADNSLRLNDPERQLQMGYGIVSKNGKSLRSVEEIRKNDIIKVRLQGGEAKALIQEIKKFKE